MDELQKSAFQDAEEAKAPDMPADEYAVVEIFGHRRHVGRVMEVDRFGAKMLRVDVPNEGDFDKGYVSHFYGGSAIFSFTGTDLDSVRRANAPWRPAGNRALPTPEEDADEAPDADDYTYPDEDDTGA